jgi:hypothetical protein
MSLAGMRTRVPLGPDEKYHRRPACVAPVPRDQGWKSVYEYLS